MQGPPAQITNDDHGAQLLPDGTLLVPAATPADDVIAMSVDKSRSNPGWCTTVSRRCCFRCVRRNVVVHGEGRATTTVHTSALAVPGPGFPLRRLTAMTSSAVALVPT